MNRENSNSKSDANKKIALLRRRLDEIDKDLMHNFVERMRLVRQVGNVKADYNLEILDQGREKALLNSNLAKVHEPNMKPAAEEFLKCLLSISRAEQYKILEREQIKKSDRIPKVAYQGLPGSYSQIATSRFFGDKYEGFGQKKFAGVFKALIDGTVDYGILPLENSSTGSIAEVYDLLMKYGCSIVGESIVEVRHCLMGVPGSEIKDIDTVFSHPQAFYQSGNFLNQYSLWRKINYYNTANSAKYVAENKNKAWAAIGAREAAIIYGLDVLADNIQNRNENSTRFIIIARDLAREEDFDKISLSFVLSHRSGTLAKVLGFFANEKINLLKIESRPIIGKSWQYRFYIDLTGNLEDETVQKSLNYLGENTKEWRLLGNYKAAINIEGELSEK